MKKSSYLLGTLAMGLLTVTLTGGCSSEDPADEGPKGGSAAGGAPAGGGAKMTGTQLVAPAYFTVLSATDAVAGPTPAPEGFTKNICSTCHGMAGQGVANLGPEIRHVPVAFSSYIVRNGRGVGMAPFPQTSLSDADLAAIQTWLAGQPKPTSGSGLYLDYCANCHGPTGGGGGVPVKAQGLPTATITTTVRAGHGTDPAQRGTYMPAFGADVLTDAEVTLIAQFLGGT